MAATNLEKDLDQAIWRRFDTKLIYTVPELEQRKLYIEILIGEFEYDPSILTETCQQLARCSFADIEQIVLKAKRKAIIERMPLQMKHMQNAIEEYNPITVAAH